jgi:hypothetical protein
MGQRLSGQAVGPRLRHNGRKGATVSGISSSAKQSETRESNSTKHNVKHENPTAQNNVKHENPTA